MSYRQEPPNCMQIELTEGCNLFCNFCGLQGIREKPGNFKFMTLDTAERLADKIAYAMKYYKWNPRLEFAMHGEPTMNPDYQDILRMFRERLPKKAHLMVTTNGGGLLKPPGITSRINSLLEVVNVLAVDAYEYVKVAPKIREEYAGPHHMYEYPRDTEASPNQRHYDEPILVMVQDISTAKKGSHSVLNNHCGAAFPPNDKGEGLRCAKPFRELSIRWDGNVAMCCNDWRGYQKVGNIREFRDLQDLWFHPVFVAARKKLYRGQRDFGPCKGCDAKSYRVGLLPDKLGQEFVEPPTELDEQILAQSLEGEPYSPVVKRPWEITPLTIGGTNVSEG